MSRAKKTREIVALIEEAFASVRYPGDDGIVDAVPYFDVERQQIAAFFKGKHWRDLSYGHLKEGYRGDKSAIVSLLSTAAFRFYFPAFLLITLLEYEEADLTASSSFNALSAGTGKDSKILAWKAERLAAFSTPELYAILSALAFVMDREHEKLRASHPDDHEEIAAIIFPQLAEAIAVISLNLEERG